MSKSAVILRNVASNWLGFAVNAAVTLVLAVLFQILLINVVTNYLSSIAGQILIGAGRVRTVATALQAIFLVCIRPTGRPGHRPQLMLQGILAGIRSVAIVGWIGTSAAERQRFLVLSLRGLWQARTLGHGYAGS